MEKNLSAELTSRNHSMDDLFKKIDLDLKRKPSKKQLEDSDEEEGDLDEPFMELDSDGCIDIKRVGIFATDLDELVAYLIVNRNLDPAATEVKIGLDDGQVCMPPHPIKVFMVAFSGYIQNMFVNAELPHGQ